MTPNFGFKVIRRGTRLASIEGYLDPQSALAPMPAARRGGPPGPRARGSVWMPRPASPAIVVPILPGTLRPAARPGRGRAGSVRLILPILGASSAPAVQTFREALTAKLESIPALAAIVGDAIYPGQLPETHDLGRDGPALTFAITSNPRGHVLAGADGTSTARVQLDAWGYQYADVDLITLALWDALDGIPGTWGTGSVVILSASHHDEQDLHQPPRTGPDQWTYHIQSDYAVKYRTGFPTLS